MNDSGPLPWGIEVDRRKPDWDRSIDSLTVQEAELAQQRTKAVRDQVSSFVRDLDALRVEVAGLRTKQDSDRSDMVATFRDELQFLRTQTDSVDKLVPYVDELKVTVQRECLERARLQEHQTALAEVMLKLEREVGKGGAKAQHDLSERLNFFEQVLGESAERAAESAAAVEKRLVALERSRGGGSPTASASSTTVERRLAAIERSEKDAAAEAERRASETDRRLVALERAVDAPRGEAERRFAALERTVEALRTERSVRPVPGESVSEARWGTLADRVEYLESAIGDSVARHASEVEALKAAVDKHRDAHSKHEREMQAMKSAHGAHATMAERLEYLEKALGDSADATAAKLEHTETRLAAAERQSSRAQAHHATLAERVDHLEGLLGESADKHAAELDALKRKAGDAQAKHSKELEAHHASVGERLAYLEKLLGQSADKHSAEVDALRAAQAKHAKELEAAKQGHAQHHATLAERVEYLEKEFGDSADKHAAEVQALKAAHSKVDASHGKHSKELDAVKAAHEQHASMAERLEQMHRELEKSVTGQNGQLQALRSKVDLIDRRLTSLGDLKAAQERLGEEVHKLQGHIHNTTEKHDATAAKLEHTETRLAAAERQSSRAQVVLSPKTTSPLSIAQHEALADRVAYLETLLGDSAAKHAAELEAIRSSHDRHTKALDSLHSASAQHATLAQRVESLERTLHDEASRHATELRAALARLEQLQGRLTACEGLGSQLKGAHESREQSRGAHAATIQERVDQLENALAKVADKHTTRLDHLSQKQEELARATTAFRGELERRIEGVGTSQDGYARALEALNAAQAKQAKALETVQQTAAEVARTGIDRLEHSVKHLEGAALDLQTKMDRAQTRLQAYESHGPALASLQQTVTKLTHDTASLEELRGSLREHLGSVQAAVEEWGRKTAKEVQDLSMASERAQGRLSTCEKLCAQLLDLERSHQTLKSEKQALQSHHATLKERVEYLEKLLGDSADAHRSELQALADKHASLANDTKMHQSRHASMAEQLKSCERGLRELAEKQAQDRTHMSEKCDQLEGLITSERRAREGQASAIESLRRAQAQAWSALVGKELIDQHHSSVTDQFGQVDRALRQVADNHARELESVKAAHGKLQADFRAREREHESLAEHVQRLKRDKDEMSGHHASIAERVDYLERLLGDSADKHAAHLEAIKDMHGKHARELDSLRKALDQQAHHATLADRLARLERAHSDAGDRHARELAATNSQVQDLYSRLAEERSAHDAHHSALQDAIVAERKAAEARLHAAQSSVRELQDAASEAADRHKGHFYAAQDAQGRIARDISECRERCELLSDHVKKIDLQLSSIARDRDGDARHGQLAPRVAACENSGRALADDLGELHRRLTAMEAQQASVFGRCERLERSLEAEEHQQSKAIQDLRLADNKLTSDLRLRESQHAAIMERIDALERDARDFHARNDEAIRPLAIRLEQLVGRVGAMDAQTGALMEMRRSQASVAHESSTFASQLVSLAERLTELDSAFGASAERQVFQAGNLESTMIKVEQLLHRMSVCESQLDSVGETVRQSSPKGGRADRALIALTDRSGDFERMFDAIGTLEASRRQQEQKSNQLANQVTALRDLLDTKADRVELQRHTDLLRTEATSVEAHAALQSRVAQLEAARAADAPAARIRYEQEQRSLAEAQLRSELLELREIVRGEGQLRAQLETTVELQDQQLHRLAGQERRMLWERDAGLSGAASSSTAALVAVEEFDGRLKSLQRTVSTHEAQIHKEIEDRKADTRRLWDAIDAQGVRSSSRSPKPPKRIEELTTTTVTEAEDTYLPFPCQPLTSFLRIGNQGGLGFDSDDGDRASPSRLRRLSPGSPAGRRR